jgi:hypothetical protein
MCQLTHALRDMLSLYAAGAISSICFGQREPLVDGNVVSNSSYWKALIV